MNRGEALEQVVADLNDAQAQFPTMHSAHQAYAVLLEEVDELWAEVKRKPGLREPFELRREASQIAATALRIMIDLT